MDMLLRQINLKDLHDLFARHREASPVPHLRDPAALARARAVARRDGLWEELGKLDPSEEIVVVRRSEFRQYRRTGDRSVPQRKATRKRQQLQQAALAFWLEHPAADRDFLQDCLWAYCDEWTWVMAAHEGCAIDLGAVGLATFLAELLAAVGDRLEDEVVARVRGELERRIIATYREAVYGDMWRTTRMNWNHVCNGGIVRIALCLYDDPHLLATLLHRVIQDMTYALDGFTKDGGCEEGTGYWNYGFGHFVEAAYALYVKTGGELNLMTDPKIERISRYPLSAQIEGRLRATFADAHHGWQGPLAARLINHFLDLPELYGLCQRTPEGDLIPGNDLHALALCSEVRYAGEPDQADYLLPDLGQAKLRGRPGAGQMTLLAIAGHNGVNHNHNDIGSYMVYRDGVIWLTDPGGPVYTRKTFSPQRYEIVHCNSYGHSVPVIDGELQGTGAAFAGTIAATGLNGDGDKQVTIDMTNAYPAGTVQRLVRTLTLDPVAQRLSLVDAYDFAASPETLEEAFILSPDLEVAIAPDGASTTLRKDGKSLAVTAVETPGCFTLERLEETAKEASDGKPIVRLRFTPATLAATMRLHFAIG